MQQMISPPRRGTMINPRASVAGIDAANGQCWYEIRALAAGRVEIFLYDVIGGWGISTQYAGGGRRHHAVIPPG